MKWRLRQRLYETRSICRGTQISGNIYRNIITAQSWRSRMMESKSSLLVFVCSERESHSHSDVKYHWWCTKGRFGWTNCSHMKRCNLCLWLCCVYMFVLWIVDLHLMWNVSFKVDYFYTYISMEWLYIKRLIRLIEVRINSKCDFFSFILVDRFESVYRCQMCVYCVIKYSWRINID